MDPDPWGRPSPAGEGGSLPDANPLPETDGGNADPPRTGPKVTCAERHFAAVGDKVVASIAELRGTVNDGPDKRIVFTGFDGKHDFKVPVIVYGIAEDDIEWYVEDTNIASVKPLVNYAPAARWAAFTPSRVGITKICALSKAKGYNVGATLVVQAYTESQVSAGEVRYNSPTDAGAANRPSCASCHRTSNGWNHSPLAIGTSTDQDVLKFVTDGVRPTSATRNLEHRWSLVGDEAAGIVAYLRALDFRAFPSE